MCYRSVCVFVCVCVCVCVCVFASDLHHEAHQGNFNIGILSYTFSPYSFITRPPLKKHFKLKALQVTPCWVTSVVSVNPGPFKSNDRGWDITPPPPTTSSSLPSGQGVSVISIRPGLQRLSLDSLHVWCVCEGVCVSIHLHMSEIFEWFGPVYVFINLCVRLCVCVHLCVCVCVCVREYLSIHA